MSNGALDPGAVIDYKLMAMRSKAKRFFTIGELLPRVMKRLGMADKLTVYRAVADWPAIVGETIARHAIAQKVEGNTLVVLVDTPAWMTQLFFLKADILNKVAQHIGTGLLTDIRFVLRGRSSCT